MQRMKISDHVTIQEMVENKLTHTISYELSYLNDFITVVKRHANMRE